jgi:hypothetical protein
MTGQNQFYVWDKLCFCDCRIDKIVKLKLTHRNSIKRREGGG